MGNINRRDFLKGVGAGAIGLRGADALADADGKDTKDGPNIVYILADDLGFGDIRCQNPDSRIPTPHIDRLAREGRRFTDAHSGSAVCTPSRYGLLTGRYSWRTQLKKGVLWPPAKPLISQDRMTVASLLQREGYRTACVGKWHLGLGWTMDGKSIDFDGRISPNPTDLGFDTYFGIPGSLDMSPYCYVRDDHVVQEPTVKVSADKFGRSGMAVEGLEPADVLPRLTREVTDIIRSHGRRKTDAPLFVYFPLTAPHKPVAPSERFRGSTEMGAYGDFVHEVDWTVGRVLKTLENAGMSDDTLVIFSADNGASPNAARSAIKRGHEPNRPLRGMKSDIWDGGHRVPFVARWPGRVPSGTVCSETVCLNDLLATVAAIKGLELPDDAGEDSFNMLPELLGREPTDDSRDTVIQFEEATVHHSVFGYFAIRKGKWKLCLCAGSGGWASEPSTKKARKMGMPPIQLYNMEKDIAEQNNVYKQHPEVVEELKNLLTDYIRKGRSTPGKPQQNWKDKNKWKGITWL